ncbi:MULTISPECIES: spore coat U domain-containing protein [unclassified Halomonas]|uniref:Csu type fimbrial protein n=1 Tax=unclassified Halomonas TaxID=2609666 RepID=UPI00209FB66D|nr:MULTISPECIES: spore coat U domain-containing protein [unclassified Halomonas]MCP1314376.1 spore coat U domain-containing protein [Halomonas sp. 707D7]MCP1328080.1 spore coat U domain-containing protein [Halomonas sp. 707D4]
MHRLPCLFKHPGRALPLLMALVLCCARAQACSVTTPNASANIGSFSSLSVNATPRSISAQPSAGLTCPGSLLGLIVTGDRVDATVTSANASRLVNAASGDAIAYQFFADPNFQSQHRIVPGTPYNYYNAYILGLLGLLGGQAAAMPLYVRTVPAAANLAAGTYRDTLTIAWNWSICTGIGIGGLCLGRRTGTGTSSISVTLVVTPDCRINAPNLNFGSSPLVSGFSPVTQTITITCTKGSSYSVGLGNGQHAEGATRRMAAGGAFLNYQIYKGATGTERWGTTGSQRRSAAQADTNPGSYTGTTAQGFIYRAEILPNQPTPPPGTYTDNIVVDVAF